jgi:uncharacterized repeat protein (TIGR03803 family)
MTIKTNTMTCGGQPVLSKLNRARRASAVFAMFAAAATALPAQTFNTLVSFDGTNGTRPGGALIQATDGNFYGTTVSGGTGLGNAGTVFKITPSGTLTTLYNFCTQFPCVDGENPYAGLVQAFNGDIYGTTLNGGTGTGAGPGSYGTLFKIGTSGALTTLYNFCSQSACMDGEDPQATLIQAANGDLYGTTTGGGADGPPNGTAFQITPGGTLTAVADFNSTDGGNPVAALVQASDGDFYGVANSGGAGGEQGTVFKISTSGTLTPLYAFCTQGAFPTCPDGAAPRGTLVQATNGDFYGTTYAAGANSGGTVFRITPGGALTTLYSFCAQGVVPNCPDGANPYAGLVQATDGNLYGTTYMGGANGFGTVFKITPGGRLTTLLSFDGANGGKPYTGLLQATNGNIYGTTLYGGTTGNGTIFSLSLDLAPFVKTLPIAGAAGAPVQILGTNLTGATSVTFNGTAAAFTVVSPSLITTTVPAGATTGTLQVVTPGGTLSSNVSFRVR